MTLSLHLSSDLSSVTDGLEAVTYRRRGERSGSAGTAVEHALRRAVTMQEASASDGRYTTSDVVWHLSSAELPQSPRLGDMVCDAAGQRWTILSAVCTMLGSRWKCVTRSLAIVFGLDDTISVLKAVPAPGGGGGDRTWRPWKTGVRARIQPAATTVSVVGGVSQTTRRFQIFLAEPLGLDATHRILAADGGVYAILGETAAGRIGELAVVEAEKVA